VTIYPYFLANFNKYKLPVNHGNKDYGQGLTWAGLEARPLKGFFPETGNWKLETTSELKKFRPT
jgi:hypothetical protein